MGVFGLLTKKEARKLVETAVVQTRSATLQNPSPELIKALSDVGLIGQAVDSGVRVDDRATLGLTAFSRGLNLLGDGVASMPLKHYKKTGDVRQVVDDQFIFRPNPWQTQYDWVKYMTIMRAARGNACSVIFRDTYYKPTHTIPVHPRFVTPIIRDNDLFYRINAPGFPSVVHHSDMIHWKGLCYENMVWGISPIEYHAQTLGISISAEKAQARDNKTGAKRFMLSGEPGVKIDDSAKKSLKQDLDEVMNNSSNGVFVPNGIKLDFLTMTPAEAEFLAQRKYGAVEVARILNIPSSLLDADNTASKSSVEQESLNFYTQTLHPLTTQFQQELDYKLISRSSEYYKFNFNSLLRADANTRADVYGKWKKLGWSDNEMRALEDVDGYDGGDRRYSDLNQIPKDLEDAYYEAKIQNMLKSNMTNNATGDNNNTQS